MSPAPAINDPGGDDSDRDELQPGDIPVANLMALVDSSSEDELGENVGPGIGYQLLAPGLDIQGPAGPGDSDDDDDDDDDEGGDDGYCGNYDPSDDVEASANVDAMPSDEFCGGDDEAEVTASSRTLPHLQVPPLGENTEVKELHDLWKTPRLNVESTAMDEDHVDSIKSAMAGFSLPSNNLPQWATVVPETEWKAQLLSRLGSGKCVTKTTCDSKVNKRSVVSSELPASSDKGHSSVSTEIVPQKLETTVQQNGLDDSGGGGGGLSK